MAKQIYDRWGDHNPLQDNDLDHGSQIRAFPRNWVGGYVTRGRKPKPTLLKILDGNPGKRPINESEPNAPDGVPDCPDWLDDEAKAEWARVIPELREMGLLSRADRPALAAYCTAWSRWVQAEAQVR